MFVNSERKLQRKEVRLEVGSTLGEVEVIPTGFESSTSGCDGSQEELDSVVGSVMGEVASVNVDRKELVLAELKLQDDLEDERAEKLKSTLLSFDDVFALEDGELGCTGMVTHKIETGDHPPIKQYPRRIPFIQRAKIASMIADMQKQGVVEPSFSSWASPVILVPKKDRSTRFCIDYRHVNAATKRMSILYLELRIFWTLWVEVGILVL